MVGLLARLDWEFFTSFPSRRAGQAGILSAWVGSLLVILVTASVVVPMGVGAGIYLEEYARKNWVTNIIEINVSNLAAVPQSSTASWRLGCSSTAWDRSQHFDSRPDPRAADPADHHRRDARGDPGRAMDHS